jgi:3-oxoacyl-[acyl-carrier-protein] synthase-3
MNFKITGTGSCIPDITKTNTEFLNSNFFDDDGNQIERSNPEIIDKFQSITGINERKYVSDEIKSSDLAAVAAQKAIKDSNIDQESLDYIIVAHNFGDISSNSSQIDTLPSLSSKVKAKLKIKNPKCVAYDIICGCPGWVEGVIQAKSFIKSGMANKCLIIGCDTLSRVSDSNDRDSMIYADGSGAIILESNDSSSSGILSHNSATYTFDGENEFLYYGGSCNPEINKNSNQKYIKMHGRKVYEFALNNVPNAMKDCFDESKCKIENLKKIFIHQANKKMDEAIIKRFYRLYKVPQPENILPMNIEEYGNSSVATIPTLFDLVKKNDYQGHKLNTGDIIMFASVGAGMNINAITYQV